MTIIPLTKVWKNPKAGNTVTYVAGAETSTCKIPLRTLDFMQPILPGWQATYIKNPVEVLWVGTKVVVPGEVHYVAIDRSLAFSSETLERIHRHDGIASRSQEIRKISHAPEAEYLFAWDQEMRLTCQVCTSMFPICRIETDEEGDRCPVCESFVEWRLETVKEAIFRIGLSEPPKDKA